jgi:hypothetical protein
MLYGLGDVAQESQDFDELGAGTHSTGMPVRVSWATNASAPKRLFSSTTTSWSSAL